MKLLKNQTQVAVLDIGSGKISAMVGRQTKDGFIIIAQSEVRYAGYYDGVWLDSANLAQDVSTAVQQLEASLGKKIKEIYVGVPGGFSTVAASEATFTCRYRKKFDRSDIADIFMKSNLYQDDIAYKAINRAPIYYVVNDVEKTIDPMGKVGTKLNGLISYVYADVAFMNKIERILLSLGITKVEFVSGALAESWFFLDPKTRDNYAILIDVGYVSTTVSLVCGDGIVFMKSFSIGSGNISADLCEILEINYNLAEDLTKKINLNLEFDAEDVYQLRNGQTANAVKTNQIVKARIDDIAYYLSKCMQLCPYVIEKSTPVFMTGGGLCHLKGGVEYLSYALDKEVRIAHSSNPLTDKPQYSSIYGIIDIVLKTKLS